jgi:hypothetical protein
MLRSKIISITVLIVFIFGTATLNCVLAGEKMQIKSHAVIHTVKFEQIEVGDTPGHIMAIMESKGISIDEITGMKLTSRGVATMDINPNAGGVTMQEYVIESDKDGDKMIVKSEGKSVAKDQFKGTWTMIGGTGKYEGGKGGGTWTAYTMGQGQAYLEVEGEVETP